MNRIKEWLMSLFATDLSSLPLPEVLKEKLTERQMDTADRLAEMKGTTRDEVLAEAYRKVDRITEDYRVANGRRRAGRS